MKSAYGKFALKEGDILISLDRPVISTGIKVARVSSSDLPSLLLQRVGRVQFKSGKVLPDFFFKWIQSPRFVDVVDPGRSMGVPHVSSREIEQMPFALIPITEQQQAVQYLDDLQIKVDNLKQLQAQARGELDALLPSILDKAFRGEL